MLKQRLCIQAAQPNYMRMASAGLGGGARLAPWAPQLLIMHNGAGVASQAPLFAGSGSQVRNTHTSRGSPAPSVADVNSEKATAVDVKTQPNDGKKRVRYSPLHHNIDFFCKQIVLTENEKKVKYRIVEIVKLCASRTFPNSRKVSGDASNSFCFVNVQLL